VTHGILFDTGSDRINPGSLPTLKGILALLENDAALKFSIEGHAANRLRSKGSGDSKPIDGNDTAEGRANNRRVEFLKIK
jgi:outer membrane protein OmpA-like peptidoglycan-associated protein